MIQANTKRVSFGKRLLTAAASLVMLATCAVTAMPVHAANVAATGTTTEFKKYLILDEDANVPNVEFEYSIVAGASTDPQITAGIDAEKVTIGKATFAPGNDTYDSQQQGDNVTLGANQVYAKQTVTVNLTQVSFPKPGIYRYTISETDPKVSGVQYDGTTRTLDVYVGYVDGSETNLEVKGYALQAGEVVNPTDKSDGFTSQYNTKDLALTKTVTGNQGDRDKFFRFEVEIFNAVNGTKYTVALPGDAPTASDMEQGDQLADVNKSELIAANGNVTAIYYLKNGQTITIQGLTAETKYTITEDSYTASGYTTSYVLDSNGSVTANTTNEQTMGNDGHNVVFTNTKEGTVPTGLLLDVVPYIALVAIVAVGLVALVLSKKRRSR